MNQGASKHATITQKAIFRRSLARAITAGCRGCLLAPLLERPGTNFNWVMVECPSHGASFNHSLNDAPQKGNRIRLHAKKRGAVLPVPGRSSGTRRPCQASALAGCRPASL